MSKRITRKKKIVKREMSKKEASSNSKYGRKRRFLDKHGGFAKDYPNKPWK